jgi:hypothetical protein
MDKKYLIQIVMLKYVKVFCEEYDIASKKILNIVKKRVIIKLSKL